MPDSTELKALRSFKNENPEAKLFVLCRTENGFEEDEVTFLPFEKGIEQIFAAAEVILENTSEV